MAISSQASVRWLAATWKRWQLSVSLAAFVACLCLSMLRVPSVLIAYDAFSQSTFLAFFALFFGSGGVSFQAEEFLCLSCFKECESFELCAFVAALDYPFEQGFSVALPCRRDCRKSIFWFLEVSLWPCSACVGTVWSDNGTGLCAVDSKLVLEY